MTYNDPIFLWVCLCQFGCFCVGPIFNLTNVLMAGVPKARKEKIKHQFVLVWGGGDVSMGWPCHYMDTGFNMSRNSGEIKHNVVAFLTEWYVVVAFIVLELFRHTISMETINKNLANTKSTQAKTFSWRSLGPHVLSTTTKTKPRHPRWPPTANYV